MIVQMSREDQARVLLILEDKIRSIKCVIEGFEDVIQENHTLLTNYGEDPGPCLVVGFGGCSGKGVNKSFEVLPGKWYRHPYALAERRIDDSHEAIVELRGIIKKGEYLMMMMTFSLGVLSLVDEEILRMNSVLGFDDTSYEELFNEYDEEAG